MVAGGKVTRLGTIAPFGPGSRRARAEMAAHIDGELAKLAFPWVGLFALVVSAALLLIKPIVLPLRALRVSFADPPLPNTVVELGYFEGAHKGFVVGGAVLAVLALVLLAGQGSSRRS